MESNKLSQIQNKYPALSKYNKVAPPTQFPAPSFKGITKDFQKSNSLIQLKGNYEQNKIDFEVPDITNITPIEGTEFGFVLLIKNGNDDRGRYFTSQRYYGKLVEAIETNNPYFINFQLKNIVTFDVNPLIELNKNLYQQEISLNSPVHVSKNTFINRIYEVEDDNTPNFQNFQLEYDYNELVKYIDWVVKSAVPFTEESESVIPTDDILTFEIEATENDLT